MLEQLCILTNTFDSTQINMSDIAEVVTAIAAVGALFFSFLSWRQSKKALVADAISSNRIEWIRIVRALINDFLKEYSNSNQSNKLINIYTQISLYCNPKHNTYSGLINAMKKCILSKDFCNDLYWDVLWEGQCVLDAAWVRMKQEAGITADTEQQVQEFVTRNACNADNKKWQAFIDLSNSKNSTEL